MVFFNYLLFDAARAGQNLHAAMEMNPNHLSLYKGWAEDDLAGVAPYLFAVKPDSDFAAWYMKEGWGQSWGIPFFANVAFDDVYRHFRKFLMVKTEEGEQLYFRFYDPRVLRIFLPTCDGVQLQELFGPVKYFVTESESENVNEGTQFWQENYELKSKEVVLLETPIADSNEKEDSTAMEIDPTGHMPIDLSQKETLAEAKLKKKLKFFLDE